MADLPLPLIIEGEAGLDYFDDNGTAMGVYVSDDNSPVFVTLRHTIDDSDYNPDHTYTQTDHPTHGLIGRRVRVTIELLEDQP